MEPLAREVGFDYSIGVMPISVAALLTPAWIARRISPPPEASQVLLPGYCDGDLSPLVERLRIPVAAGPKDLRQLPEFYGRSPRPMPDYGDYEIEILAEINHAPRLTLDQIRRQARQLADDGADVIDVGCQPGDPWPGVAACVRALRDDGHRVSIDSRDPLEIQWAVRAGAELVLSVDRSNRDAAPDWGCPVVAIPDRIGTLEGLDATLDALAAAAVPFRIDPVVEPIGFGLAASLGRYLEARRRYPAAEMLMGVGNLTELTDVDSAGINVLLLGFCQEQGIRSVLTTQVINWARSSVRECDLARRLVHYAVRHRALPKHVDPRLVVLRDPRLHTFGAAYFDRLAAQIKDHNYRLFAEDDQLHLVSAGLHLADANPFALFQRLLATHPKNVDASHAFYLGFELAKALVALTLGKEYRQDESLDWGHLTAPDPRAPRTGRT